MKIIEPSATILEPELAGLSVCQRIDRLASVCYQRPPKPTEEDAEAFCRRLIERGHLPALEFAVVHLVMPWGKADKFSVEKYLLVDQISASHGCVTGSMRAFFEVGGVMGDWLRKSFLAHQFTTIFNDGIGVYSGYVGLLDQDEIPWQHKHVAVRVICSRAISHQLVRHRPCAFLQESSRFCKYDDGVTFIRPEWAEDGLQADYFETQCYSSEAMYKSRRNAGLAPQQARGALPNDTKTELIMYASLPEWRHIFKMRCAKAADPEARRIMVPLREEFEREYPEMWEEK